VPKSVVLATAEGFCLDYSSFKQQEKTLRIFKFLMIIPFGLLTTDSLAFDKEAWK